MFHKQKYTYFLQNKKLYQEVRAWGWVPWSLQEGPQACEQLGELGVLKMACSDKSVLVLTTNNTVYTLSNNNGSLVILSLYFLHFFSFFWLKKQKMFFFSILKKLKLLPIKIL